MKKILLSFIFITGALVLQLSTTDANAKPIEEPTKKSPEKIIQVFKGEGMTNTRPFKVSGKWEIQWDAKGDVFNISLLNMGTSIPIPEIVAYQIKPGKGASFQPNSGEFMLKVASTGTWTIRIVSFEN